MGTKRQLLKKYKALYKSMESYFGEQSSKTPKQKPVTPKVTPKVSKEPSFKTNKESNPSELSTSSDISKQQKWLFNNKMFNKNITEKQAIDGVAGSLTNAAISKAKQLGYVLNEDGTFIKNEGKSWQPSQRGCKIVYNPVTKQYTSECAEYANQELAAFKGGTYYKGTAGDAWTRIMNGDEIQSGYDDLEDFKETWNPFDNETKRKYQYSLKAADAFEKKFDINSLRPGEVYMANMYFKGSPNVDKAFDNGTGIRGKHKATRGTHTGNIYFDSNTGEWRISHNIHGREHNESIKDVLGGNHRYGVTAISRVRHNKNGGKLVKAHKFRNGGSILKFQEGGAPFKYTKFAPTTIEKDTHIRDYPEGMDLTFMGISRERAKAPLKRYTNSDSPMIASALSDVYHNREKIMNTYNLTPDEFMNLIANTHSILYKESNGGYPLYKTANGTQKNKTYLYRHLTPIMNTGRHIVNFFKGKETSEGLGSVKSDSFTEGGPKIKYDNFGENSSAFGGLSTIQLQADNWNQLKKMFSGNDQKLLYNEDGSMSDLANTLLIASHNAGVKNIQKNYDAYLKDGNLSHLTQFLPEHKDQRTKIVDGVRVPDTGHWYVDAALDVRNGHQYQGTKPIQLPEILVIK